jgi:hypothetical protein
MAQAERDAKCQLRTHAAQQMACAGCKLLYYVPADRYADIVRAFAGRGLEVIGEVRRWFGLHVPRFGGGFEVNLSLARGGPLETFASRDYLRAYDSAAQRFSSGPPSGAAKVTCRCPR